MKDSIVERKNGIIEAIQNGNADDFVGTFPEFKGVFEETKDEMDQLVERMDEYYRELGGDNVDPDDHQERKEFALAVQEFPVGEVQGLFFQRLTGEIEDFWDGLQETKTENVAAALSKL